MTALHNLLTLALLAALCGFGALMLTGRAPAHGCVAIGGAMQAGCR